MKLETHNLTLKLTSLEQARAEVDAMSQMEKEQLSDDWLALLASATETDPWIIGFQIFHREQNDVVGQCGFKGPPTDEGVVEIAYFVYPGSEGNGYATEAARALVDYAMQQKTVSLVRAHTLPETNASTSVLTKCGFQRTGEVVDPNDGIVWRWDLPRDVVDV